MCLGGSGAADGLGVWLAVGVKWLSSEGEERACWGGFVDMTLGELGSVSGV